MQASPRRLEPESVGLPTPELKTFVFRSLLSRAGRTGRTVHLFVVTSIALHAGVLAVLSFHRRAASGPTETQVRVALVASSALPSRKPSPASRPAEKLTPARTPRSRQSPKPLLPRREIVPFTQPQAPAAEPEPTESGAEEPGGDGPGVASGQDGGAPQAIALAPPPPPLKPAAPVFESEGNVRRRRIAGHDPAYPPKAERNGIEGVVVAKVIIGPDGRVNDIIIMQTHSAFESTVRDAIAGWRFSPLVVDGKAATVYTIFRFTFKLS